jgi:RHS repeat-associated protein
MVKPSIVKKLSVTFDYDPFGMMLSGRNWEVGSEYRYGFNGKESDSETYGDGNIYDYGFRIYNPRLGRFLSVDPITNSYPHLTPYQFASNRPIDGIDLDGLEYITYIITVESETGVIKIETIDYRDAENFNYKKYSQSFGAQGRGIKYIYNFVDENGNPTGRTEIEWAQKQGFNGIFYHGLFYGKGAISKVGPFFKIDNGNGVNTYLWEAKPIDMMDAIAREHDIEMDVWDYEKGDRKNPEYVFADIRIWKRAWLYLEESSKEGYVDPYTGKAPSKEAQKAAKNAYQFFRGQINKKTRMIQRQYNRGEITKEQYNEWHRQVKETLNEKVELPSN